MSGLFKAPEVLKQIQAFGKKLEELKTDIQLCNQALKNTPQAGLNPKGPIYQILNTVEECRFFFDQLLKAHNLKYLPMPEETTDSEQTSPEKKTTEPSKEKQPAPVKKDEKPAVR
jgi:hypothetical protein